MFAKTLLFLVLGAALVLAVPVEEKSKEKEIGKELEAKWNSATKAVDSAWKKILEAGNKKVIEGISETKVKTLAEIEEGKKLTRQVYIEGKKVKPELEKIVKSLLKMTSKVDINDKVIQSTKKRLLEIFKSIKEIISSSKTAA